MLYAIVSDIHANRQAWEAVLNDIRAHAVDEILCLGDIVDYGPAPADVLKSVYAHCRHIVTGNHDAALCGRLDPANFNPRARTALEWTRHEIGAKALRVLRALPLIMHGEHFRCAHATPLSPSQYGYIMSPEDAHPAWDSFPEQVCFIGHTHLPALFVRRNQGRTRQVTCQDFELEESKRYIVNVGSVGQPRDGRMLASYALFDSTARAVFFREVAFDVEAYDKEISATALPRDNIGFLRIAEGQALPPVREMIDFAPPDRATEKATVKNLEDLEKSLHRWKLFTVLALALVVALSAAIAGMIFLWDGGTGTLYERTTLIAMIEDPSVDEPLLQPPEAVGEVNEENRLSWFNVILDDPGSQSVFAEAEGDQSDIDPGPMLRVKAETLAGFSISSVPVMAPRGSRFRAAMQFKSPAVEGGFVELVVAEALPNGSIRFLARSEPRILRRQDRWYVCSDTVDEPLRGEETIYFLLRGEMVGEICFRKLEFTRVE